MRRTERPSRPCASALATSRRKIDVFWSVVNGAPESESRRGDRRDIVKHLGLATDVLRNGLFFQCAADVEEIVGDHAEPDPTLHSGVALVAAAAKPVPPFDHADASLASGPPFLAVAEPTLLLLALALGAFGRAIGNADAFDALLFAVASFLAE